MARVRVTPNIQPVRQEAGLQYEQRTAAMYPTGLQQAMDATAQVANQVMGVGSQMMKQEQKQAAFDARITEADKANTFTNYQNQMGTIQKEASMQMSLAPDSDKRKQIRVDADSRMKELNSNYEYRADQKVSDWSNTFYANSDIMFRGLEGQMRINEQKNLMGTSLSTTVTSNLPQEAKIRKMEEVVEGNINAGVISTTQANAISDEFVRSTERYDMDKSAAPTSLASISTGIKSATFMSPEDINTQTSYYKEAYTKQREMVNNSSLSDEEKTSRLNNIKIAEDVLPSQLQRKYDKQVTSTISKGSDLIKTTFSNPEVSVEDTQDVLDYIESESDENVKASLQAMYDSALVKRDKSIDQYRTGVADQVANAVKVNIASGALPVDKALSKISDKLFTTVNGKRSINKKLTPGERDAYSTLYMNLVEDNDEVLTLTKDTVKQQKSLGLLPSMTPANIRKAIEEAEDEEWADIDLETRQKKSRELAAPSVKYNRIYTKQLTKSIDRFYVKNNRLPEGEELDTIVNKVQDETDTLNFIDNSVSKKIKSKSSRRVITKEVPQVAIDPTKLPSYTEMKLGGL